MAAPGFARTMLSVVIPSYNHGAYLHASLEALLAQELEGGFEVLLGCWERGLLIRTTGDTIAMSPPLIVESSHIEQMIGILSDVLKTVP